MSAVPIPEAAVRGADADRELRDVGCDEAVAGLVRLEAPRPRRARERAVHLGDHAGVAGTPEALDVVGSAASSSAPAAASRQVAAFSSISSRKGSSPGVAFRIRTSRSITKKRVAGPASRAERVRLAGAGGDERARDPRVPLDPVARSSLEREHMFV